MKMKILGILVLSAAVFFLAGFKLPSLPVPDEVNKALQVGTKAGQKALVAARGISDSEEYFIGRAVAARSPEVVDRSLAVAARSLAVGAGRSLAAGVGHSLAAVAVRNPGAGAAQAVRWLAHTTERTPTCLHTYRNDARC